MTVTCLSFSSNRFPRMRIAMQSPGFTEFIARFWEVSDSNSREMYTTTGDGSMRACARMPACVTVFAMHCITVPSWGQHTMHSISKLNDTFPPINTPMVCERMMHEPGLTKPSAMHRPLTWAETRCMRCVWRSLKLWISENGKHTLCRITVVVYNESSPGSHLLMMAMVTVNMSWLQ